MINKIVFAHNVINKIINNMISKASSDVRLNYYLELLSSYLNDQQHVLVVMINFNEAFDDSRICLKRWTGKE